MVAMVGSASEGAKGAAEPVNIFVSYAREDRARAETLIAALSEAGHAVWWDALIEGGLPFAASIEEALARAQAVIVIWSPTSAASHWVRDEAEAGRDRGILVPVSFDGTLPPLGFRQIQVVDLSGWKGGREGAGFTAVERAIALAGSERAPAGLDQPSGSSPASRRLVLTGIGTAVLALGGALTWRGSWFSSGSVDNSVAVIPFKNLSGDPNQTYLADGISEEIRQELMRNSGLRVMGPASVSTAISQTETTSAFAGKLGVALVLTGSVQRNGDRLRVSAELTDGKGGYSLWADRFERPVSNIFEVQSEIAGRVGELMIAQSTALRWKRTDTQSSGIGGTRNLDAFDALIRGTAYYAEGSSEALRRAALRQFDRAIEADGRYARAHMKRALTLVVIGNAYGKPGETKQLYREALQSARRAVKLAPDFAEAHSMLAYVLAQGMLQLKEAGEAHGKALKLGPNNPQVLSYFSIYAAQTGQRRASTDAIERVLDLDPFSAGQFNIAAFVRLFARDFVGAKAAAEKGLAINPRKSQIRSWLGDALYHMRRPSEARAAYLAEPIEMYRLTGLAIVEHRLGNAAGAIAALTKLIAAFGDGATYQMAQIYAQWSRHDEAISKLQLAPAVGDVGIAQMAGDPMLDPVRKRPEFSRLLESLEQAYG